jgi:hypothetical protein
MEASARLNAHVDEVCIVFGQRDGAGLHGDVLCHILRELFWAALERCGCGHRVCFSGSCRGGCDIFLLFVSGQTVGGRIVVNFGGAIDKKVSTVAIFW